MSLEDDIRSAFAAGAEEIVVRVGRYARDCRTPEAFQALVRPRSRHVAHRVGIRSNPIAALTAALRGEPVEETTAPPVVSEMANDTGDIFG